MCIKRITKKIINIDLNTCVRKIFFHIFVDDQYWNESKLTKITSFHLSILNKTDQNCLELMISSFRSLSIFIIVHIYTSCFEHVHIYLEKSGHKDVHVLLKYMYTHVDTQSTTVSLGHVLKHSVPFMHVNLPVHTIIRWNRPMWQCVLKQCLLYRYKLEGLNVYTLFLVMPIYKVLIYKWQSFVYFREKEVILCHI